MTTRTFEILVIGAGPGGTSIANAALEHCESVAQIERDKLGGICHNYGCDPTKTLLETAKLLHHIRQAGKHGLRVGDVSFDWSAVQTWKHEALEDILGGTQEEAWKKTKEQGIHLIRGEARFVSAHEVRVGDQTIRADTIILAPGTVAAVPEVEGLTDVGFLTNKEAVDIDEVPRRLAVLGSGAIGIEFAQMFRRFGAEVTVLERDEALISIEDREIADALCAVLRDEGIEMQAGVEIERVERVGGAKRLTYTLDKKTHTLDVDEILVATGRKPELDALDLQAAGVETHEKGIKVDEHMRTTQSHIYAIGDVASKYQFTHSASEQAEIVIHNIFEKKPRSFEDCVIPWVTYTDPELAHVGQTEEELKENGIAYKAATEELGDNERAVTMGQTKGSVKLLVDDDGKIVGCHILATNAGDMIAAVVVAMQNKLTAAELASGILPYPTLAQSVRTAASKLA